MSVYDSIREGIKEDWLKAQRYPIMKAELEAKLNHALANPDHDAWENGYHSGWEACRRLYAGERPLNQTELWEDFKKARAQPSNNTGGKE